MWRVLLRILNLNDQERKELSFNDETDTYQSKPRRMLDKKSWEGCMKMKKADKKKYIAIYFGISLLYTMVSDANANGDAPTLSFAKLAIIYCLS